MKTIRYNFCVGKVNTGTEEAPVWEELLSPVEIGCRTEKEYQKNLPLAEKEAYNGEIAVEGEFEPETEEPSVWDELDAAYREGVDSL